MAKTTTDGVVLSTGTPTVTLVRKAMESEAQAIVASKNAKAKPGVKWGWSWGWRGIQLSVSHDPSLLKKVAVK